LSNSETVSEKRRGRPATFSDLDALAAIWPAVRTRPGIQNKAYLTQAMAALFPRGVRDVPKYEWFAGDARQFRQSILVEIGRVATLYGAETARAMADKMSVRFSEADMTTSEVAAWLRGQRLQAQGRSRRGRAAALAARLWTEVVSYLSEHPDADARLVSDAISVLMENVEHLERAKEVPPSPSPRRA
jgi:hypothetical protein